MTKIRTGFVTNSSSSSFIIAIQGGIENLDRIVEIENEKWKRLMVSLITTAMESEGSGDTAPAEVLFDDIEGLNKYLDDNDWLEPKDKKQYVAWVSDGWVVYRKSVDYNDTGTKELLNNIDGDGIKVIYHAD
jgi:hypothetical protein